MKASFTKPDECIFPLHTRFLVGRLSFKWTKHLTVPKNSQLFFFITIERMFILWKIWWAVGRIETWMHDCAYLVIFFIVCITGYPVNRVAELHIVLSNLALFSTCYILSSKVILLPKYMGFCGKARSKHFAWNQPVLQTGANRNVSSPEEIDSGKNNSAIALM